VITSPNCYLDISHSAEVTSKSDQSLPSTIAICVPASLNQAVPEISLLLRQCLAHFLFFTTVQYDQNDREPSVTRKRTGTFPLVSPAAITSSYPLSRLYTPTQILSLETQFQNAVKEFDSNRPEREIEPLHVTSPMPSINASQADHPSMTELGTMSKTEP
jgi:hypothetical protein